jgi:hypothetical protein
MQRGFHGGLSLLAILSLALAIAACGSSSNDTTATSATLSKAEFLKKGNEICAKGNKQINKIASQTFPNNQKPTSAQVKQFTSQSAPLIQAQIDGVKALGAPAGDSAKVDQITSQAQSALDEVKTNPELFLQGDPFKKANQAANAYGLTACGGGGGGGGNS